MGRSSGNIEHFIDEAMENVTPNEALDAMGVPRRLHADIQDFLGLGGDINKLSPDVISPELKTYLERNGLLDRDALESRIYDSMRDLVYEQARDLADAEGPSRGFTDVQRLVDPDLTEDTYFEIGVKEPRYEGSYRHYDGAPKGTIGHVRGSFLPEPYMDDFVPIEGSTANFGINHPGAMLIEEIQSDANKGVKQTGPLHQVHGVLFKAAVQHALENGATTVYMPTALTIANVRGKRASAYAPIYDQQIVKEGINPLKKIKGVTVSEMFDEEGNHVMNRIDFEPSAVKHILEGEGQKLPGYKIGGHVNRNRK